MTSARGGISDLIVTSLERLTEINFRPDQSGGPNNPRQKTARSVTPSHISCLIVSSLEVLSLAKSLTSIIVLEHLPGISLSCCVLLTSSRALSGLNGMERWAATNMQTTKSGTERTGLGSLKSAPSDEFAFLELLYLGLPSLLVVCQVQLYHNYIIQDLLGSFLQGITAKARETYIGERLEERCNTWLIDPSYVIVLDRKS